MKISKITAYIFIISIIFNMLISISSCGEINTQNNTGKLKITATLFPQYDFAKQIAKDKADVTLLLPPGVESHSFDPKPGDILDIYKSDLFIYTGENMEPWANNIIHGITDENLLVVDCSKNIELIHEDDEHEDSGDRHEDEHGADPHIWLDPVLCEKIIDNILSALCEKDSANADFYTQNAEDYKEKLRKYDNDMFDVIKNAKHDTIVFGGRFAYIYFLRHFGLKYITAYDSCSSLAEPSASKIVYVINYIEENNIQYIYHEELSDPKVAKSIAEAAGIEYLMFSTAHNVTKTEFDSGITFLDIMYANLANIQKGLS